MVLRANKHFDGHRRPPLDVRIVRQPLRGRLQPLLPGQGRRRQRRPDLLSGARRPGHLRARVPRGPARPRSQLDHFRREVVPGEGLSSYPHPRLMPDFWEFPTVSMGLGPDHRASTRRGSTDTCTPAGIADTADSRVWAFSATARPTSPSRSARSHLAAREGLDNLDLRRQLQPAAARRTGARQRQDHPGARGRLPRCGLERHQGHLGARVGRPARRATSTASCVQQMNDTVDGEFQKFSTWPTARTSASTSSGRIRACASSSNTCPTTNWPSSGAAGTTTARCTRPTRRPSSTRVAPTVILAKTVKGWALGEGFEARNVTHQMKKLNLEQLTSLPRPAASCRSPTRKLKDAPYYHPGPKSRRRSSTCNDRRTALGGSVPRRVVRTPRPCPSRRTRVDAEFTGGSPRRCPRRWPSPGSCASSSATRTSGRASCRSSRTRRARSAWTRCSSEVGIYSALGPALRAGRRRSRPARTARRRTARCWRRASPRPGRWPRSTAAGTRVRDAMAERRSRSTSSTRCSASSGRATRCGRSAMPAAGGS